MPAAAALLLLRGSFCWEPVQSGSATVALNWSCWTGYDDPAKQEVLWRRKWTRSGHLGKKSYKERGVTADEYAAYWGYVSARWREHGLDRVEAVSGRIHRVDAHAGDRSAQVERILRALEPS